MDGVSHIIQVSAIKMDQHEEVDQFDSFVYSDVPLHSFINGLTGITADKIAKAPKLESVLADFKSFVGDTPLIGRYLDNMSNPVHCVELQIKGNISF